MVSLRSIALLGARSSVFSKDTVAISDFLFRPSVCRTGKSWGLNSELSGAMHGLGPEIPEDLYHLIKKAVAVRKHLERNRKDKDSKFRLILIESRVHRLARYYKRTKKLPPTWKYESATASTLVA
ncbi:small ribosomal subunit protein uS15y isoform X2 [Physcomitrium patens]|uniref:small ribosomal subunit protein uS15y isoform X2 n=1 Tax=Physcomitrium patens TaxID=3218 RepID=UPI000D16A568|nr:40S ribosomal protein S13-2 isoform X2 [Physcomitrium patens]|eukprot:XP_024379702.1 40S ribosomal protein S13-2 isoform X2 [Physcomitrella patens]